MIVTLVGGQLSGLSFALRNLQPMDRSMTNFGATARKRVEKEVSVTVRIKNRFSLFGQEESDSLQAGQLNGASIMKAPSLQWHRQHKWTGF